MPAQVTHLAVIHLNYSVVEMQTFFKATAYTVIVRYVHPRIVK